MPYQVPRVQIVPQADDQVSFQVEGQEKLRWHACPRYLRPFFYPLVGPSGRSVTRMGHPAAPDHDHHRSFWWGHQNVGGVNFWEERGGTQQVRQDAWVHYQDGPEEAGIVVRIGAPTLGKVDDADRCVAIGGDEHHCSDRLSPSRRIAIRHAARCAW